MTLEEQVEYWRNDSAAAWDKCEERRKESRANYEAAAKWKEVALQFQEDNGDLEDRLDSAREIIASLSKVFMNVMKYVDENARFDNGNTDPAGYNDEGAHYGRKFLNEQEDALDQLIEKSKLI